MPGALVVLVLLVLIVAVFPAWPYSRHWGYGPSGGLSLLTILVGVALLLGVH